MKRLLIFLPLLFVVFSSTAFAQSTDFKITRNLGFKESSKIQSVDIKISEKTSTLKLEIACAVRKGTVTIEIYNPENEKQGEFTIEGMESEGDGSLFSELTEGVTGHINKIINDPSLGNWQIKFIPKDATGRVNIQSRQVLY
ncbi:hypothetical protein [Winogradskyella tangerina]|uniref:hypothetical protein n=1 Tax=Winogradskyella tangerina TaxID=2023240 RepID=UPI000DBEA4F5|nr:hypothetical protein [Winogradskyella tangerina]